MLFEKNFEANKTRIARILLLNLYSFSNCCVNWPQFQRTQGLLTFVSLVFMVKSMNSLHEVCSPLEIAYHLAKNVQGKRARHLTM